MVEVNNNAARFNSIWSEAYMNYQSTSAHNGDLFKQQNELRGLKIQAMGLKKSLEAMELKVRIAKEKLAVAEKAEA